MYEKNLGEKLLSIARVVFAAGVIVSVIAGIILASFNMDVLGTIIAIAGSLISWLVNLLLASFGQLVSASYEMRITLNEVAETNRRTAELLNKLAAGSDAKKSAEEDFPAEKSSMPDNISTIFCPYCGQKTPDGLTFCIHCGEKIEED